jgi:tetratricopeptide (TPR) repeat protein
MDAQRSVELALEHHRAGRLDEAEGAYRQALDTDPNNVDALHFTGVLAFQRRDYPRAREFITRALSHDANNAAAHNNLGNVLDAQGKPEDAMRSYIAALALDPDNADALSNLAALLLKRDNPEQAERCYRRAFAAAPSHAVARDQLERLQHERQRKLQDLLAEEGRSASADADAHIALGKRFKASGTPDKAFAHYEQALALAPGSAPAHYYVGNARMAAGRFDEAIARYSRAVALVPEFADAHINLGYALQASGRLDEAAASYRRALSLQPGIADAFQPGRSQGAAGPMPRAPALGLQLAPAFVFLRLTGKRFWQGRPRTRSYFRAHLRSSRMRRRLASEWRRTVRECSPRQGGARFYLSSSL